VAWRFLSRWWWRWYIPPKRRILQEPHGVTSQKTAFFVIRSYLQDRYHRVLVNSDSNITLNGNLLLLESFRDQFLVPCFFSSMLMMCQM
jgi:hypothetical protein